MKIEHTAMDFHGVNRTSQVSISVPVHDREAGIIQLSPRNWMFRPAINRLPYNIDYLKIILQFEGFLDGIL